MTKILHSAAYFRLHLTIYKLGMQETSVFGFSMEL